MRTQILMILVAFSFAIELTQNKPDSFPNTKESPLQRSHRSKHFPTNAEVNSAQWFNEHTKVGPNYIVIPGAYRIHYHNYNDSNDNKLVARKTEVQEIVHDVEDKADKKIEDDKKEIKNLNKILEKNVEILKTVENIESKPLDQKLAQKAAVLEEKVINEINKEQKKIDDLKSDIKETKILMETAETLEEIDKKAAKKAEKNDKKPADEGAKQLDKEIEAKKVLEETQRKMAPKVIEELKKELYRENDFRDSQAAVFVGSQNK